MVVVTSLPLRVSTTEKSLLLTGFVPSLRTLRVKRAREPTLALTGPENPRTVRSASLASVIEKLSIRIGQTLSAVAEPTNEIWIYFEFLNLSSDSS